VLATLLAVAAVCGPAGGVTLAQSESARVLARGGAVRGCTRGTRGSVRLGDAGPVIGARVAGRYGLVRRRGERLTVYDLRTGRSEGSAGRVPGIRFLSIRLYPQGVAAWIARRPDGRQDLGSTDDTPFIGGGGVEPRSVRLAADVIAYRRGNGIEDIVLDSVHPVPDSRLGRLGRVVVALRRGDLVTARLAGGIRRVELGRTMSQCFSSSGCGGVDRVEVRGRFAAGRETSLDFANSYYEGHITVGDLRSGARRAACRSFRVQSFVVTGAGAVACALEPALDGNRRPGTPRIVAEDEVLDKGPGIDLSSLRRRGGELVWLHDGAERTAPLPRRG
jgi:hypothetical protein